jgi:iron complex outermembrane receptor protein
MTKELNLRGSFGRAYRMPTVAELFLNSGQTGATTIANPNLQPQVSSAYDLTGVYRKVDAFNGAVGLLQPRISLFMEDRWNAIFSQSILAAPVLQQHSKLMLARLSLKVLRLSSSLKIC